MPAMMNRPLPIIAVLLGLAGLIPFLGCGLLALGAEGERGMMALAAYGAVILAFLGGVHWGFALQDPTGTAERKRLSLGVVPSLTGWVALLLAVAVRPDFGVALLLAGFIAIIVVEVRAHRAGLMPRGYLNLRYGLSAVVILVLAIVLVMRALGAHITL